MTLKRKSLERRQVIPISFKITLEQKIKLDKILERKGMNLTAFYRSSANLFIEDFENDLWKIEIIQELKEMLHFYSDEEIKKAKIKINLDKKIKGMNEKELISLVLTLKGVS